MNRILGRILPAVTLCALGCGWSTDAYTPASSISRNGFARDAGAVRGLNGRIVKIWGFVDHANLYGDEGVGEVLGEWWSGDAAGAAAWRFNLKAREDDAAGRSFPIHVLSDEGRDALLEVFVADARARRPTRVFVRGTLFTYAAPTQGAALTGLYMEVRSSRDISLEPPQERP
jgi:hypothetical protein